VNGGQVVLPQPPPTRRMALIVSSQRCALVLSPRFGGGPTASLQADLCPAVSTANHIRRAGSTFTNTAVRKLGSVQSHSSVNIIGRQGTEEEPGNRMVWDSPSETRPPYEMPRDIWLDRS